MNAPFPSRFALLLPFLLGLYTCLHLGCRTRVLDYRQEIIYGFPETLCEQTNLKKLSFGSSGVTLYPPLSAVPTESTNRIDSLPACIANMTELEELSLSAVGLQQLPPAFFQLQNLRSLDLSFNPDLKLDLYWEELAKLPELASLAVVGCEFDSNNLRTFQTARPEVEVITPEKQKTQR